MGQIDNEFSLFIKPFKADGTLADDFIEATRDIQAISGISIDTDSSDYKIGTFTISNLTVTLNNQDGKYSDVGSQRSIFKFKRSESIVKVEYRLQAEGPQTGLAIVGEDFISDPLEVYEGLLNDDSNKLDAKNDQIRFRIIGKENVFDKVEVQFDQLTPGDTISDLMFDILNQTDITDLFTLSAGNINPQLDQVPDSIAPLENQTVREALDDLLFLSNSIMRVEDDIIKVSSRAETAAVQFTFFGQNSMAGAENISKLNKIGNGKNKTFNFFTWKDNPAGRFIDNDSRKIHGVRKQELDFDHFTDTIKQINLQRELVEEFKDPKEEFEITVPVTYDILALRLLDKVNVDYPVVYVESENFILPICGQAICGEAVLPTGLFSFSIPTSRSYKIVRRILNPQKVEATFKLRET